MGNSLNIYYLCGKLFLNLPLTHYPNINTHHILPEETGNHEKVRNITEKFACYWKVMKIGEFVESTNNCKCCKEETQVGDKNH